VLADSLVAAIVPAAELAFDPSILKLPEVGAAPAAATLSVVGAHPPLKAQAT